MCPWHRMISTAQRGDVEWEALLAEGLDPRIRLSLPPCDLVRWEAVAMRDFVGHPEPC